MSCLAAVSESSESESDHEEIIMPRKKESEEVNQGDNEMAENGHDNEDESDEEGSTTSAHYIHYPLLP